MTIKGCFLLILDGIILSKLKGYIKSFAQFITVQTRKV